MEPEFIHVAQPNIGPKEIEAVRNVLLSGHYASGARVEEFEAKFAKYIGVDHAIAVNSGTAALHIALEAMGIGEGDEVIVPPLTFFATISAVLYLKAIPVFADIDLDDFCLSPQSVKEVITPKTKAVIPVHLFGAPAKMDHFLYLAERHNISILEDCAQAHGSEFKGRKVGRMGKTGAFSFFATKHMTTGEGGMITTSDAEIAEKARIIRNHGMTNRDEHSVLGYNNRMTEIEAALGLVQLVKLDEMNAQRISNSEYLIAECNKIDWTLIPRVHQENTHTYFWCPLMVDEAKTEKKIEELKSHFQKHRIGFRQRYQEPLYRQPVLKKMGLDYSNVSLVNTEAAAGKIIGLPNHPGLSEEQLKRVIDVIREF